VAFAALVESGSDEMGLPPHIIETVRLIQIEDAAIKALLTSFFPPTMLCL
jgi:hypothetical protein